MMKRHITIIIVLLAGCLSMVAQRRITPVNTPATTTQSINENKLPTDSIDYSKLVKYRDDKGNVVLVDTVSGIEIPDTTAMPKVPPMIYPLLKDVTVGVNLWDPLMRAFGQSYGLVGFSAEVNLHNRYIPVIEAGLGNANDTPADNNYTYYSPMSPYFKIGINYNFLYNSNPDYQVFAGMRYGFSPFKWELRDVTASGGTGYWDTPATIDFPGQTATAGYLEILFGLRVRLFGNFSAGWSFRYHKVLHQTSVTNGKPLYIPGYGATNSAITGSLSIFYTIPLSGNRHRASREPLTVETPPTLAE